MTQWLKLRTHIIVKTVPNLYESSLGIRLDTFYIYLDVLGIYLDTFGIHLGTLAIQDIPPSEVTQVF